MQQTPLGAESMSISTTITLPQLAKMVGRDPASLSKYRHVLPPATPARAGNNGRPPMAYDLGELTRFILDRTGFLSDAEARLRLALEDVMGKPLCREPIFDEAGKVLYLPPGYDLNQLTAEQRAQLTAEQRAICAARARRHSEPAN